jgi:hypothetical protein
VAVVGVLALLNACASGGDDRAAAPTTTTAVPVPTSSTSTSSSSSTSLAPSSTVTSRPSTSMAAPPETQAKALYDAWAAGDRTAAGRVAAAEAVTTLFARPWRAGDGWTFDACSGAAGSLICGWKQPGGQMVLFRVQNANPATVTEVRFQP